MLTAGRGWRSPACRPIVHQDKGGGGCAETTVDTRDGEHEPDASTKLAGLEGLEAGLEAGLVAMFADSPTAPFSIHRIVLEGALQGSVAGSWLGPTSISQVLATLVARAQGTQCEEQGVGHAEEQGVGRDVEQTEERSTEQAVGHGEEQPAEPGVWRGEQGEGQVEELAEEHAEDHAEEHAEEHTEEHAEEHAEGHGVESARSADAVVPATSEGAPNAEPELGEQQGQQHAPVGDAPVDPVVTDVDDGLNSGARAYVSMLPPFWVHVAMDGVIYRNQILALAHQSDDSWRPVLLLVPLRLGLEQMNAAYAPCIQSVFGLPQSLGIIGGRPRRSHYFIGSQGDQLLYLDPHEVQPALSAQEPQLDSCHFARNIRTTPLVDIDPSLALGFLCASAADFDDLCGSCERIFATGLPLFSVSMSPPPWPGSEALGDEGEEDMVLV